jgi:hypothetical protein
MKQHRRPRSGKTVTILFERKGNSIKNLETGEVQTYKSRNLAKKESRNLQKGRPQGILTALFVPVKKPKEKKGK